MKFSTITKKIASLAASAAIVASIVAVNAFAADSATLVAPETAKAGDKVTVTLNVTTDALATYEVDVVADNENVKFAGKTAVDTTSAADQKVEATPSGIGNGGKVAGAVAVVKVDEDGMPTNEEGQFKYEGAVATYTVMIPADAKVGDEIKLSLATAKINGADVAVEAKTIKIVGDESSQDSSSETDSSSTPDSSSVAPVVSSSEADSSSVAPVVSSSEADSSSTAPVSSVADSSKADASSTKPAGTTSSTTAPVKNNNTNSTANKTTNPSTGAAASATVAVAALAGAAVVVAKKRK